MNQNLPQTPIQCIAPKLCPDAPLRTRELNLRLLSVQKGKNLFPKIPSTPSQSPRKPLECPDAPKKRPRL